MEELQGCSRSVRFIRSSSALLSWPPNSWIMSKIIWFGSPWGNAHGVIVWCWFVKMNGFPSFSNFVSRDAHTGQHHLDTPKAPYIIICVRKNQAGHGNGRLTDPL